MPVMPCKKNGRSGFKWGKSGKCYMYTRGNKSSRERARAKAARQGKAIKSNSGG